MDGKTKSSNRYWVDKVFGGYLVIDRTINQIAEAIRGSTGDKNVALLDCVILNEVDAGLRPMPAHFQACIDEGRRSRQNMVEYIARQDAKERRVDGR